MGSSSSIQSGPKPIVLVLGGGYGGVAAATTLDATNQFFVILIDRKDYFYHNVASLRGGVNSITAQQTLIPYNKLLNNGMVLQADIVQVNATYVIIHGHPTPIAFDYLVIATGTSYSFPSTTRVNDRTLAVAATRFAQFHSQVASSSDIVVVGGGSVGIELAAEIKESYPKANVTIVHSGTKLLHSEPRLKEEFITRTMTQLAGLDVKVVLNDRVPSLVGEDGNKTAVAGLGTVTTSNGQSLVCDLLLYTGAAATNINSLTATFGSVLVNGRLTVNSHMQVEGYTNIFAVGDIAGTAVKRAMHAGNQGKIAAKNIDLLLKNSQPSAKTAPLESWVDFVGFPLLLTIGARGGVSQFFNAGETVKGSIITSMFKSKGLFSKDNWAGLNQKKLFNKIADGKQKEELSDATIRFDVENVANQERINTLATVLGITNEDAKKVLVTGMDPIQIGADQVRV